MQCRAVKSSALLMGAYLGATRIIPQVPATQAKLEIKTYISTALYCTVLHCTALNCTVLYCIELHCTRPHCKVLDYTAQHFTVGPVYPPSAPDLTSLSRDQTPHTGDCSHKWEWWPLYTGKWTIALTDHKTSFLGEIASLFIDRFVSEWGWK